MPTASCGLEQDRQVAEKGYTLIEVLMVMVVLAILAAIAAPRYLGVREQAYISTMKGDLHHLRLVQEEHRREEGPTYISDLTQLGDAFHPSPGVTLTVVAVNEEGYTARAVHDGTAHVCIYSTLGGGVRCGDPEVERDLDDDPLWRGEGNSIIGTPPVQERTVPRPDGSGP